METNKLNERRTGGEDTFMENDEGVQSSVRTARMSARPCVELGVRTLTSHKGSYCKY